MSTDNSSNNSPTIVLASGSPQRRKLLEAAGYQFRIVKPSDAAEAAAEECGACSSTGPAGLVAELALRKAADVVEQLVDSKDTLTGDCVVVACDTIAECGGEILGKPADEDHARMMLERLSGSDHRVYSGLCLWPMGDILAGGNNTGDDAAPQRSAVPKPQVRVAITQLRMDPLSDGQLDEYLASGQWRGKAGAFGYQDRSGWLHITDGSESNVIGLPMELLAEMLAQLDQA